jgi:hypothetical protein
VSGERGDDADADETRFRIKRHNVITMRIDS